MSEYRFLGRGCFAGTISRFLFSMPPTQGGGGAMSDALTVRDHSQPCEHGELFFHVIKDQTGWVQTGQCPGGREIVLRRPRTDGGRKPDPLTVWVEVEHE